MMIVKTYSELRTLGTFEERLKYLALRGSVGVATFGSDRYFNQEFYRSSTWRSLRNKIIVRDEARDLGIPGYEIYDGVRIHHMNPVSLDLLEEEDPSLFDPEFLICTSIRTHNAIHFGIAKDFNRLPKERKRGDTIPWRAF